MKRILTLCAAFGFITASFAQTDTTGKQNVPPAEDTIRIGGMIIIRKPGSKDEEKKPGILKIKDRKHSEKPSNLSTNWWIVDLGFNNYTDKSVYPNSIASVTKADMKLKAGKSRNLNVWFFMQKLNIAKHAVNLKYGLGLELNNYFFENEKVVFTKNPTKITVGTTEFKKVKLAADYLTVPMMLNFNFTPKREKGFGFSAGMSAGYLYSARYKTKDGSKVEKVKSDFDLNRFKLSYIGELSLGPVKLYGSMATKNMWEKGLDMTPYNFGFRLSKW